MIKHLKQKKYGNKPDTEFLYSVPDEDKGAFIILFFSNCGWKYSKWTGDR